LIWSNRLLVAYTDRLVRMVRRFLNMVAKVSMWDGFVDDVCRDTHFLQLIR